LFEIGTVSSTTSTPSVTLTSASNTDGDTKYTMNMVLPQGNAGTNGTNGKSAYFSIGTVSSTTDSPSVTQTSTTDGNGDTQYTLNFVLKH
jgi:hypothetical protein